MNDYDVYIFDLDDTLIHSFELARQYYYPELTKFLKKHLNKNNINKYWGDDIISSLENILKTKIMEPKVVENFLSDLHKRRPVEVINNTLRIITTLKKHNKWICLYSSSHPKIMMTDIKYGLSGISDNFDLIYSTVNQQTDKPSKKIVDNILEQYRIQQGAHANRLKVLLVGDSVKDYLTARNSEISFSAVLTGVTNRNEFIEQGLDDKQIFPSIEDIFNLEGCGIVAIIRNEKNEFLLVKEGREHNQYYNHWSGPHGRCNKDDIIEEETVVRETLEECNIEVIPLRKLYTREADTKIKTVSFWEAKMKSKSDEVSIKPNFEISQISWMPLDKILSDEIQIYPGTIDFFKKITTLL